MYVQEQIDGGEGLSLPSSSEVEANLYYDSSFQSYAPTAQPSTDSTQHLTQERERQQAALPLAKRRRYSRPPQAMSERQLRKANQRLATQIAAVRTIRQEYLANQSVIREQEREIAKLRRLASKALDPEYHLSLERQEKEKGNRSMMLQRRVRAEGGRARQLRYRMLRQLQAESDPWGVESQIAVMSGGRQLTRQQMRVMAVRREYLHLRKREEINQRRLELLERKRQRYEALVDECEGYLSRGSASSLARRATFLRNEIEGKRQLYLGAQLEHQLQVTSLNHQIAQVQIMILKASAAAHQTGEKGGSAGRMRPKRALFKTKPAVGGVATQRVANPQVMDGLRAASLGVSPKSGGKKESGSAGSEGRMAVEKYFYDAQRRRNRLMARQRTQ